MTGEARQSSNEQGPLDGVTVLDASRVLAGPFCTMQLGDLGAEVIKVERPGTGDQTRTWTPPEHPGTGEAAYYLSCNRNKRSVTLNLASEAGREVYRDLAREADVVVENFRVGKTDEWGLGYADLREENPGLVYCSLTGYGEWGPDRDRPAYDLVVQAEAGMMSVTGEEGGKPVRVGVAIADLATGLYASQSILSALLGRELGDGTGQKVDVSLFDAAVALNSYMASFYFATGDPPGRMGSRHPTIVPYQAFPTRDGYVVIAVPSGNLWPEFCAAIDREDLIEDPRFATNPDRVENRETLEPLLEEEIATYGTDEVVETMRENGVPATPIHEMDDVFEHPQVLARGMRTSVDHPSGTTIGMAGIPMHFSETGAVVRRHPPAVGEHTDEILAELGRSAEEIDRLREEDVV